MVAIGYPPNSGGGGGGGTPSNTVVTETAFGQAANAGTASPYSRGDHTHGTPAAPSVPTASASVVTETAYSQVSAVGVAGTFSRGDHTHGTPAPVDISGKANDSAVVHNTGAENVAGVKTFTSAPIVPAGAFPESAINGLAADLAALVPITRTLTAGNGLTGGGDLSANRSFVVAWAIVGSSAVGDAAAQGTAVTSARSDHVHGREAFGAVTAQTSFGASSANGTATTVSHSDHTHGTPTAPATPYTVMPFSQAGVLTATPGTARLYNDSGRTLTINAVRASVGTPPSGASIKVDINKDGTTIFTTQANRPTIAIAGNTSGKVTNMDVTTIADGSYFTVDVDQIGSGTAGSDLTVQIWVS